MPFNYLFYIENNLTKSNWHNNGTKIPHLDTNGTKIIPLKHPNLETGVVLAKWFIIYNWNN